MKDRLLRTWDKATHPTNYISSVYLRNELTKSSAQMMSGAALTELLSIGLANPYIERGVYLFAGVSIGIGLQAV